jgi:hypothetical protein
VLWALTPLLLLALAGTALLAGLLYLWFRRPFLARLGWGATISLLLLGLYFVDNIHRPLMDDGPYTGTEVGLPAGPPASTFALDGDRKLVVYSAPDSAHAPIVCHLPALGVTEADWCRDIGVPNAQVDSISFREWNSAGLGKIVVDGTVYWTYGAEHTRWMLRGSHLKDFWYSW